MTKDLKLNNWLSGSVDYVPEGKNLITLPTYSPRSIELREYLNNIDKGIFHPQLIIAKELINELTSKREKLQAPSANDLALSTINNEDVTQELDLLSQEVQVLKEGLDVKALEVGFEHNRFNTERAQVVYNSLLRSFYQNYNVVISETIKKALPDNFPALSDNQKIETLIKISSSLLPTLSTEKSVNSDNFFVLNLGKTGSEETFNRLSSKSVELLPGKVLSSITEYKDLEGNSFLNEDPCSSSQATDSDHRASFSAYASESSQNLAISPIFFAPSSLLANAGKDSSLLEGEKWEENPSPLPNLDTFFASSEESKNLFGASISFSWLREADLSKRASLCLKECFGLNDFRPLQKDIIDSVLRGQDTLAILATGSGKSLCYQIPALCVEGCALVVSPLIALMDDQVQQLRSYGIGAALINAGTSPEETEAIFKALRNQELKFLYVAPERIVHDRFLAKLASCPISLIAVDEAHCVSQWGHDFRPHYRYLRKIRQAFNYFMPIIACTATARLDTRDDIIESLDLSNPTVIVGDFDRKNISLSVEKVDGMGRRYNKAISLCKDRENLPCIIYCAFRKTVEELCSRLQNAGIKATRYHAELSLEERNQNQKSFISGQSKVIVATVAFGMGINKSDVRAVIHFDYPYNMESYYQEIGRAGRDGLPARAILFDDPSAREFRENILLQEISKKEQNSRGNPNPSAYANSRSSSFFGLGVNNSNANRSLPPFPDQPSGGEEIAVPKHQTLDMDRPEIDSNPERSPEIKLKRLNEVFDYVDAENCRRRVLLGAFSQYLNKDCGNCDVCLGSSYDTIEFSRDLHAVIGLVKVFNQKIDITTLGKILSSKAKVEIELSRSFGLAQLDPPLYFDNIVERIKNLVNETFVYGYSYWANFISQLLELGVFRLDKKYVFLHITDLGVELLLNKQTLKLKRTPALVKRNIFKVNLLRNLDELRHTCAEGIGQKYDSILSDPMMMSISEKLPKTKEELLAIDGFTKNRVELLGSFIIYFVELYHKQVESRNPNIKKL